MRYLPLLLALAVNFAPTDYVWVNGYGWVRGAMVQTQAPGDSGASGAGASSSGGAGGGGNGGHGH